MVLVFGLTLPVATPVLADTTGPKFPTNYAIGTTGFAPDSPARALVDDVAIGDADSTKCAEFRQSGGNSEIYYGFGFGIPSGATIDGLEVVVSGFNDIHADDPLTFSIGLSGDTGGSWTDYRETPTLGVTDDNYILGGSTDLWGKAWNAGNFSDGNFRLEVAANRTGHGDIVCLDSVSVIVYYHGGVNAPTITSIIANQGTQGQTQQIIITGTNLTDATAVSFGAGITINSFTVNSAVQITASITIDASAVAGARDISVTTPGGTATLTGGFIVVHQNQATGTGAPTSHGGSSVSGPSSPAPPVSLPNIQIQSAGISAAVVTPDTPITVTASISNRSTVNGNKKVTVYVNGQVETSQGVMVNSGDSSELTFNVSRSEPGEYTVYVDGVPAGSFKVEFLRESDGILIFSVTMLAIAFLIGMVMLWRRQCSG